jgi:hypothetical protein
VAGRSAGPQFVKACTRRFRGNAASGGHVTATPTPRQLFDLVSVDAYRDAGNAAGYRDALRAYRRFGKPVAVTEFGCCTYRDAHLTFVTWN